jgi:hypothetical protein
MVGSEAEGVETWPRPARRKFFFLPSCQPVPLGDIPVQQLIPYE